MLLLDDILADLQLLEEIDQLCIDAARSLVSNRWLTKQIDDGQFNLENFRLYNQRIGGGILAPQEKCKLLGRGLQKLSKASRSMLDDGSTVQEIYVHLQSELYKHVWKYHLCLCDEEDQAKPYFDRLDDDDDHDKDEVVVRLDRCRLACDCDNRKDAEQVAAARHPHLSGNSLRHDCCSTNALVADLNAVGQLKGFAVSWQGFALHDTSKPFVSHWQLMQVVRNVFDSFDAQLVSRAFAVPLEVCESFKKDLAARRREVNLLLATIMQGLSKEACEALQSGKSFADVEERWQAEIERRNIELGHF